MLVGRRAEFDRILRLWRRVVDHVRERLITDTAGDPPALVSAFASPTDDQLNGLASSAGTPSFGRDLESMYAQRLHPLPSSSPTLAEAESREVRCSG